MNPEVHAAAQPDKVAQVMGGTGEAITYGELNDRSNRLAQLLWNRGLRPGDHVAILMENNPRFLEVAWALDRSGHVTTPINSFLTAEEAAYIVNDSGCTAIISSALLASVASELVALAPAANVRLMVDGAVDGWDRYEDATTEHRAEPLAHQPLGAPMYYSSGTTGQPKGIVRPFPEGLTIHDEHPLSALFGSAFHLDADTVYLCPAPLFHGAPFAFSLVTQRLGGTVVVMDRFDAEAALGLIDRYRVTVGQYVPTMFVRMLKLPPELRSGYDLSSQRWALHAAAPCPVEVKRRMIDWWGPILLEYYGGSEMNGLTFIDSHDWLSYPGSVGRPMFGELHIVDDQGTEQPPGEPGAIYFGNGGQFHYHNAPEKTAAATLSNGWTTVGDVGYVDNGGRLFLTDRRAYMIVSGGVNVYPQQTEDLLTLHPDVEDVAVFGIPDEELGEVVHAVVQPVDSAAAGEELEEELIAHCRANLAHYKCPRSITFDPALPRQDTGKLFKRVLRDRYWQGHATRIN